MSSFSDRIEITSPPSILQTDGMSQELRNSIWNFLLKTLFEGNEDFYKHVVPFICERFLKFPIDNLPYRGYDKKKWLREIFFQQDFHWFQIYNLVEFIAHNYNEMRTNINKIQFIEGINEILKEEMSGYRFIEGYLTPISSQEEMESIGKAIQLAKKSNLSGTVQHLETAIELLSKKPNPDYRNSIKESISAVESLVKQLSGEEAGGLDRALSKLETKLKFHGAFKAGLLSLYGYTSDEDGIRHAILEEPSVGFDEAKFMLVSCSALVNFLIAKASSCGLISWC